MGLGKAAAVAPAVREMTRRLGLSAGLGELGVDRSLFPRIIGGALKDHTHKTNPREPSAEDYEALLTASL